MSGNGAGRIRCLRMRNFTRVNPKKWHFNVNIIYSAEIPGSGQNTTNIKSQCILTGNIAELSHVQCNFGSWFSEPAGLHLGVIGWREALQESPPDFMGKTWENPWFPVDFPFQSSVFYLSGNFGYSPSPASPGPAGPGPCCLSATPWSQTRDVTLWLWLT